MKKSIILLLGLVLLIAIPALASTPENENMPAPTSEDQQFMGLTQLSEEELMEISGNLNHQGCGGEPVDGYINETPYPSIWVPNKDSYDQTSAGSYTGEGTGGHYSNPYTPKPDVVL